MCHLLVLRTQVVPGSSHWRMANGQWAPLISTGTLITDQGPTEHVLAAQWD